MDRKQWFKDRIGTRVFRYYKCDCPLCKKIYEIGTIIMDIDFAIDMYDHEVLFNSEGTLLKYFDTKEERTNYEIENKLI